MKRYRIICGECGSGREVGIIKGALNEIIDWLGNGPDPQVVKIISGRKRLDGQWGWQCVCGNNDLLTKQELKTIKDPAQPAPQELSKIIKNLKPDKPRFKMEAV